MSQLLLNCETPDTAIRSIAEILIVTPAALLESLRSCELIGDESVEGFEQKLVERFLIDAELPDFSVVWFHGTRLHRDHTLMLEGLLPTHMIKEQIRTRLQSLCEGLERVGNSPFSTSRIFKPSIEGPFGVLCRGAAVTPMGCNGNYISRPELVDDIAGDFLGENFRELTTRFAQESESCVVHFIGRPCDGVLQKALRFVYETKVEGRDTIESANSSTAGFNGHGRPIPPEMILKIERLSSGSSCSD